MNIVSEVVYFVEFDVYNTDTSTIERMYCGTHGKQPREYTSVVDVSGDFAVNEWYNPRLRDPGNYETSLFSGSRTYGESETSIGTVTLINADGALDSMIEYGFDGRYIREWRGTVSGGVLTVSPWVTGVMEYAEHYYRTGEPSTLVLTVRDKQGLLDAAIQTTLYLGNNTGGSVETEGTASDLKGNPKPLGFGRVTNATVPCVDTGDLVYQLHDGAIQSVDAVYDKGVTLTKNTAVGTAGDFATVALMPNGATIGAGQYVTCKAYGFIKLGSTPAGAITVDFKGSTVGGYAEDVANVCKALFVRSGLTAGTDYNEASFTALASARSYPIGIYLTAEASYADVVWLLLNSIGAYGYFDRLGVFYVGLFGEPLSADWSYTETQILSVARQASADTERGLPCYKITVDYAKNYTVQSADSLAGAASVSRIALVTQEYRKATSEDASVLTAHPFAKDMLRQSLICVEADAQTFADSLLDIYGVYRQIYIIKLKTGDLIQLNDTVSITMSRFGMESGKLFRVLSIVENAVGGTQELTLWG